jgi:hypothetical protein
MESAMHFDSLGIYGDFDGNNMDNWEEAEEEETEAWSRNFSVRRRRIVAPESAI